MTAPVSSSSPKSIRTTPVSYTHLDDEYEYDEERGEFAGDAPDSVDNDEDIDYNDPESIKRAALKDGYKRQV